MNANKREHLFCDGAIDCCAAGIRVAACRYSDKVSKLHEREKSSYLLMRVWSLRRPAVQGLRKKSEGIVDNGVAMALLESSNRYCCLGSVSATTESSGSHSGRRIDALTVLELHGHVL